jgi:hypothetical protein
MIFDGTETHIARLVLCTDLNQFRANRPLVLVSKIGRCAGAVTERNGKQASIELSNCILWTNDVCWSEGFVEWRPCLQKTSHDTAVPARWLREL